MNLETYYIGGAKADNLIRIYNKALEQKIDNVDWWRIEGQLRGEYVKSLVNPFKDIRIFKPMAINDTDLKVQEKAILYYIQQYPEHLGELTKNTRKKYFELLENISTPLEIEPFEIYENHIDDLKKEIEIYLNLADNNILLEKEGIVLV